MINKKFEAYKVEREIKRCGTKYIFERNKSNKFGEPIDDTKIVCKINGLYHEQNSNVQITTGDTTQSRTKKIPMILCLWGDDVQKLIVGDFVVINTKVFRVTGIVNVQEWNIIADISLEVVDDGIRD